MSTYEQIATEVLKGKKKLIAGNHDLLDDDISDTKILSLPDSIWNLSLDSINMSGTGIR